MAAKFDPGRNESLALPVLYEKYSQKIKETKSVLARLNGGTPLPIVPEEWADCWIVRFLIGFKEDPELAGKAFYDAHMWRNERGLESIRQKMAAGLQPKDFPHAGKVKPFFPTMLHGQCRHGLPVEYNFTGFVDPPGLLKSASFEEILEVFIYDAEYKFNMLMTMSLERNVLVRLQNVFDGKGFAFTKHLNRSNIGVLKSVMDQITPRYVEMAEKIQIINCPFSTIVKQLVNHVVPERALQKFSITGEKWFDGVTKHIEPEQLHPCLQKGGPSVLEALGIKREDSAADMELQTVAAGKKVDLAVAVAPGSDLCYSFLSEGHDVGLSITLNLSNGESVAVMAAERIHGDHKFSGSFPASLHGGGGGGTLKIVLDNSYSWRTKKNVRWQVENVSPVSEIPVG